MPRPGRVLRTAVRLPPTASKRSLLLNKLSRAECFELLLQATKNANRAKWVRYNSHLTPEEQSRILDAEVLTIEDFPDDKPVYTVLAGAKPAEGTMYANIKVIKHGYNEPIHIHRIACKAGGGDPPKTAPFEEWQASHVLSGFAGAGRNINPKHLKWELGVVNRARKFCELVFRAEMGFAFDRVGQDQPAAPEVPEDDWAVPTSAATAVPGHGTEEYNDYLRHEHEDRLIAAESEGLDLLAEMTGLYESGEEGRERIREMEANARSLVMDSCSRVHFPPCRFYSVAEWGPLNPDLNKKNLP